MRFFNVSKFDFKKNNGVTFGIAFQHSFSEIYLAIDSINNNPHTLQSYLISLDYKQDKFENFNPLTGQLTIASPDVISLRAVYNFYFFHYKHSAKTKYTFIPTLAGKINMKDYNGTKLLNYLRRENTTDDLDVLFTSRTTFDGKYGAIDNNLTTAQVSVSLPIAFDRIFKNSPILCPIPYFSYDVFMNDKPRINGGIALGILSNPIVDLATNANGSSYYRKFNVPSYFSIGVDWNYQDGAGSKPNFYVAGSIKIQ